MISTNSIVAKDKLDQLLKVGDCVVWPKNNKLEIGCIVKIHPKMIKVKKFEPKKRWDPVTWNKYPVDLVKLEGPMVSLYILKKSGDT